MDLFNTLQENFNALMEGYMDKLKLDTLYNNKLNAGIIAYILLLVIFRPYKAHELANKPYVQLFMTGIIIYVYRTNRYTAVLLTVAFLSSITLESDTVYNRNIPSMPIQNRETFNDGRGRDDDNDDIVDNKSSGDNDDDNDGDDDSDDDDDDGDDDGDSDDDSYDDEDNDDDSDNEENDNNNSNIKSKPSKKTKMEKFNMRELFPKNSLNDTFKDLHVAIHKLENFVNSDVQ